MVGAGQHPNRYRECPAFQAIPEWFHPPVTAVQSQEGAPPFPPLIFPQDQTHVDFYSVVTCPISLANRLPGHRDTSAERPPIKTPTLGAIATSFF